jgi:autotransporter translocation and assembly factor TamB
MMGAKILRFLLWFGTGLISLLVLAGIVLWFYTQSDHFRTLLREQALAALRDSINGEVTFERISGSVWSELRFHDLSVLQDGVEIIQAPEVAVKVNLFRQAISFLLSSSLHIGKLEITKPWIRLEEDEQGGWNILSLVKKADQPEEPSRVSILLSRIKIEGGRIDARMADGREGRLSEFALDGDLSLLPSGMKADLDVGEFSLAFSGIPDTRWASALSYEMTGSDSSLHLRRLDLRTSRSHLSLSGKVQGLSAPTVALNVELERAAADEIKEFLPSVPLRQDFSGNFRVNGPLSAFQLAGTLKAPAGELTATVLADLTRTPHWYRGTLEAKRFVVNEVLELDDVSGNINGKASFEGTSLETAQASAQAQISGLSIQGWQIGDLAMKANLADTKLGLSGETTGKGGQANFQGGFILSQVPAYDLALKVRNLDVQKVRAENRESALAANMNLDLWVKGRGADLQTMDTTAKLNLLPSRVGAVAAVEGKAAAVLRDGRLNLQEVKLFAGDTTLGAHGQIGAIEQDPQGKILYSVRSKNIAPWLELADLKGNGRLNIDGTASGRFKALNLEGKANVSDFQLSEYSLQRGAVSWTLAEMGSSQLRGNIKASANDVNAAIRLKTVEANVALQGLEPIEIDANVSAQDQEQQVHRLKAHLQYLPERLNVLLQELALQLPNGAWRMPQQARVVVRGKTMTVDDLLLQSGAQNIRAKGSVGLQGTQDLHVEVNRFSLEDLRPFFQNFPDISGRLSAEAQLGGTAASPVIESTLNAASLKIAGQPYAGLAGKGNYRQERLNVDLVLQQDASHALSAKGGVPIYLGWEGEKSRSVLGEANLRIHSDSLSPAFLGLLSKDVQEIKGNLTVDILLRGPFDALAPKGKIELQGGQARVKNLGLSLTDMDLHVGVTPEALHVTRLVARSGEGGLTGSGKLGLRNYSITTLGLTLDADQFRVIHTRQYKAAVSGRLASSGSLEKPFIKGALKLVESSLRPDLAAFRQRGPAPPDPTVVVARNREELASRQQRAADTHETEGEKSEGSSVKPNGLYRQLGLDLTATVPRGTWIHVEDGSIELMGEVRARKNPGEDLSLTGAIETLRGWYSFQGRKFQIEKGRVTFTGGSKIDPSLEIVGLYKLPKYEVELVVGGNASKPELTLRSNPRLEQADILSVLIFGQPVGALSDGQRASLKGEAIKATTNYLAPGLRQSVAERLGVDNLEFDVGEGGGSKIGVGKYVTKDVFISTSQQLDQKREQEYSVEYEIAPSWELKSSTTSRGDSGIDIFWRKQY